MACKQCLIFKRYLSVVLWLGTCSLLRHLWHSKQIAFYQQEPLSKQLKHVLLQVAILVEKQPSWMMQRGTTLVIIASACQVMYP